MLSFATEFPVDPNTDKIAFFAAVQHWLINSPHYTFAVSDFPTSFPSGTWAFQRGSTRIDYLECDTDVEQAAAAKLTDSTDQIEWATNVVFSKTDGVSWVGIRTSREALGTKRELPPARKPVLVKDMLTRLSGGSDGVLRVEERPVFLSNNDISLAASVINRSAGCRLPVVYVSCGFDGLPLIDADSLARKLAGMAHVLVEPNRPFASRLKIDVGSQNAYGGAIGIYWPDTKGREIHFVEIGTRVRVERQIVEDVRTALINRRPLQRCTWPHVQDLYSQKQYQILRSSPDKKVDDWIQRFDEDERKYKTRIEELSREIDRLNAVLSSKNSIPAGVTLLMNGEEDFFQNETREVLIDVLEGSLDNLQEDSRRQHLLRAIIDANPKATSLRSRREQLRSVLRGYRSMDQNVRSKLTALGFSIDESGKHPKLVYHDDERYSFTLPSTGSDNRGGLNSVSDIAKRVF